MNRTPSLKLLLCWGVASIVCASGCVSFSKFKPYVSARPRAAAKKKQAVRINVWRAPSKFTPYTAPAPIAAYIKNGLAAEFRSAGYVVHDRARRPLVINATVNQYDLGFETYWWNTIVFFIGYSSVEVFAVADITVNLTVPTTGNTYRRRFYALTNDKARALWIGPLLPILPIPVGGVTNEEQEMLKVSQKCFGQIVAAVDVLLHRERSVAAPRGWREVAALSERSGR